MTPPAAAAVLPGAHPARPAPARPGRPARPAGPARRPSPPARPAAPARTPRDRPGRAAAPVGRVTRLDTFAASRLLDRLIRSRLWIGLIAFSLIGIVAMQLWLLKLNGGIGRAIEHESYLQRENAALSAENAAASAGDLVEQHAVAAGMTIVAPGSLIFLHTRGLADEHLAAARLSQPVPTPGSTTAGTATASATSSEASASAAAPAATATVASTESSTQTSTGATVTTAGTEATQPAPQPEPGG
jgi:hypothetical protein